MIVKDGEFADLATPSGPMRTHMFRPAARGQYPGIVFFSEIFQVTGPIRRTAVMLAGHGYVVAVPENYHELEPLGAIIPYDQAGADRGNANKIAKPVSAYDADARAALDYLKTLPDCTGSLGAMANFGQQAAFAHPRFSRQRHALPTPGLNRCHSQFKRF